MSYKFRDIAGVAAAVVLATLCLAGAAHHVKIIVDLKANGVKVPAHVVGFKRGARNSKWAVYRYVTNDSREITARDKFQQFIKRVKEGESVAIIYDRNDVRTVTADLGIWIWQGPAIFLSGSVLLAVLAFVLWRHRAS